MSSRSSETLAVECSALGWHVMALFKGQIHHPHGGTPSHKHIYGNNWNHRQRVRPVRVVGQLEGYMNLEEGKVISNRPHSLWDSRIPCACQVIRSEQSRTGEHLTHHPLPIYGRGM